MLPPIQSFFDPKTVWRERMKASRKEAAQARPDAARHAARIFLDNIDISDGDVVSLYYPIGTELDTEPLAQALFEREASVALPIVAEKDAPLMFRLYVPGDPLIPGAYGEQIPAETAPEAIPTILVVPLLGFTRQGGRLGYGGGYYDRTLEELRAHGRATAIGYAFAAQEVDELPLTRLDQRLDWIVTERGAIHC